MFRLGEESSNLNSEVPGICAWPGISTASLKVTIVFLSHSLALVPGTNVPKSNIAHSVMEKILKFRMTSSCSVWAEKFGWKIRLRRAEREPALLFKMLGGQRRLPRWLGGKCFVLALSQGFLCVLCALCVKNSCLQFFASFKSEIDT